MQATTTSSHHVSPISCPPQEKPQVTLADVLRGGAENDRRSLQAYLHTLAAREKEKRKRKRNDRKSKRSSSSTGSKRRKRSDDDLSASTGATGSSGSIESSSSTPSGSIDMSHMSMRGSVDLTAMRMASNEYDAMRGSVDLSAAHNMRSRSVDFGALRSNTAAFDAMRASLDMSAMGPGLGLGAHYSHHGSFAGYQHHGSFVHPLSRASCDFDATGFGADISPTSSFSLEGGPVFLEPAPLASFSVDDHSPQQHHQQQHSFQQPHPVQQQQHYQPQQQMMQQNHHHQPQQMHHQQMQQQQQAVVTDLPDFEDFVSSAFLQAFPDEGNAAAAFNPALLLEPGVPESQPSPDAPAPSAAPVFAVPAPPQHVLQRSQSPATIQHQHQHHQQQVYQHQQHQHHQAQRSCSCPDCHVTPVSASDFVSAPSATQHGNYQMQQQHHQHQQQLSPATMVQHHQSDSSALLEQCGPLPSPGAPFGVPGEEDQVENFLAQFIEWSEQRGVASPSSASSPAASSPATSLYY
jgi:hypothetical protein